MKRDYCLSACKGAAGSDCCLNSCSKTRTAVFWFKVFVVFSSRYFCPKIIQLSLSVGNEVAPPNSFMLSVTVRPCLKQPVKRLSKHCLLKAGDCLRQVKLQTVMKKPWAFGITKDWSINTGGCLVKSTTKTGLTVLTSLQYLWMTFAKTVLCNTGKLINENVISVELNPTKLKKIYTEMIASFWNPFSELEFQRSY